MKINGYDIKMIRGDTEGIIVSVKTKDGEDKPLTEGDTIYFTVKKSIYTDEILLQKVITTFDDGKAHINISPGDTKGLRYGTYVYDIQMNSSAGAVKTIVPPSVFEVCGEVTYD